MKTKFAFPIVTTHGDNPQELTVVDQGMTLRDYFAGQAIASVCLTNERSITVEEIALFAYAVADAMMQERIRNVPR